MQPFNIPKNPTQNLPKKQTNPFNRYPGGTPQSDMQISSPPTNTLKKPPMNAPFGLQQKSSEVHFEESPREPISGGLQIQEDAYENRPGNQLEHDESVNIGEMTEKGNDDEEPTDSRFEKPTVDL